MSHRVLHRMDSAWLSSDATVLAVTADADSFDGDGQGGGSNRLVATGAASGSSAGFDVGPIPIDLGAYDELRFWIRGGRAADGTMTRPFYLEVSYDDAGDAPGEEHRWLVPVVRSGRWERRRIGIGGDRRSAITRFRFRCLADGPFACNIDELVAVREEMLLDLERALVDHLEGGLVVPGLVDVPLQVPAVPGDSAVVLPLRPGFGAGNLVRLSVENPPGTVVSEDHLVVLVADDTGAGRTTLDFAPSDAVAGTFPAGTSRASLVVPVVADRPTAPDDAPRPAVVATLLDAREDPERTAFITQRDSFRRRGAQLVCSVRPAARGYLIDYRFEVRATDRMQELTLGSQLLGRIRMDVPVRILGEPAPVWVLGPTAADGRAPSTPGAVFARFGTRQETAPRAERTLARVAEVQSGWIGATDDREGIQIIL